MERDVLVALACKQLGFMKSLIRRPFLAERGIADREDFWAGEHLLLYVESLARGARMRLLPDALYIYQVRPGPASKRVEVGEEMRKAYAVIRGIVCPG